MTDPADDLRSRFRAEKFHALVQLLKAAEAERREHWRIARAEAQALLGRSDGSSAHSDWMDWCVPHLLDLGKPQDEAVAGCLNWWRSDWEENHPDGAVDPGPPLPEDDE